MKRLFIYSMLVASSLGAMTSCSDFLDVKPVGAVSEEELLNQEGVNYAITGMYSSMLTQEYFAAPLTNYAYGDVLGGSANKGSTFTDQSDFTNLETYAITTDNGYLNTKWKVVYEGVYRANNVINMIDKIKDELSSVKGVSKDFYTEAIAQARFFRGFWHFEGMKLFGAAIPYVGSEEFASDVNPKVWMSLAIIFTYGIRWLRIYSSLMITCRIFGRAIKGVSINGPPPLSWQN